MWGLPNAETLAPVLCGHARPVCSIPPGRNITPTGLIPCFTFRHLSSPCFNLDAVAESASPDRVPLLSTLCDVNECSPADRRVRGPPPTGTDTLLHLASPCFTLLQTERSRGIGLLISSDGHRLVGNDQRVRSVPRSACAVTDMGLRVGAEVGQDTLLHHSALRY